MVDEAQRWRPVLFQEHLLGERVHEGFDAVLAPVSHMTMPHHISQYWISADRTIQPLHCTACGLSAQRQVETTSSPVGIPQVHKCLLHELAHKHHELVQPQAVDAEPLSPHGCKEHPKVPKCNLRFQTPRICLWRVASCHDCLCVATSSTSNLPPH